MDLLPGDQVVWIDDHSSLEETLRIEHELEKDARFRVVFRDRKDEGFGVAHALNDGLFRCVNELVARIDADDYCLPGRLERQFHQMKSTTSIVGSGMMVMERGNTRTMLPGVDPLTCLLAGRPVCFHPTWLFRSQDVISVGGYPTEYPHAEDFALSCVMFKSGFRFQNVDEALIFKDQHPDRASKAHGPEQYLSVRRAIRDLLS